jgi:uncharacterized membrane protein YidH (DUF202 family)
LFESCIPFYDNLGKETEDHTDILTIPSKQYNDIWETIATQITSVYFDSPKTMVMYKDRIARVESAQLFRIRWYGGKGTNKNPSDNDVVFLELKTHHEQWIQDKSIKERVAVKAKDVSKVLSRDKSVVNTWSKEKAIEIIMNAKRDMKGEEIEEAVDLLMRIRHLVIKKNLQPCVRSSYLRVAFQSQSNNALRFTIDRDIVLSSEQDAPLGSFYTRCEDSNPQARSSVTMPVSVFEVKLSGSASPAWVDELIGSQKIQDGHKFSKYLSGASILFDEDVESFPYWAEYPEFEGFYNNYKNPSFIENAREINKNNDNSCLYSTDDSDSVNSCGRLVKPTVPDTNICNPRRKKRCNQKIIQKQRAKIEPKTYFAAERTFIQWISASLLLISVAALLFSFAEQYNNSGTRINGTILSIVAFFITVYALGIYFRRLYLLQNGKPYGYKDHAAPVVLTVAVLLGIGSIFYHTPMGSSFGMSNSYLQEDVYGNCVKLQYSGVSKLEFQPSDVAIDLQTGVSIIASNHQIAGIKYGHVNILASKAGSDFEGLVLVDDIIYALSEDNMLYAFGWDESSILEAKNLKELARCVLNLLHNNISIHCFLYTTIIFDQII